MNPSPTVNDIIAGLLYGNPGIRVALVMSSPPPSARSCQLPNGSSIRIITAKYPGLYRGIMVDFAFCFDYSRWKDGPEAPEMEHLLETRVRQAAYRFG